MDYNLQLDKWGLPTENGDGGDSCNRFSVYAVAAKWTGGTVLGISKFLSYFTHPWIPGLLRRHPDTSKWYGDWQRMSRDQTYPYLMACKEYGEYRKVLGYILGHALRLFLFTTNVRNNGATPENQGQNYGGGTYDYSLKCPDLTGPDFWSVEIRALPSILTILFYPILFVFDFYTMLSAIHLRYFNKNQTDVIDHVMMSIFCQRHYPTPWTWIMNRFINNSKDLQARLDSFFAYEYQPKMNLIVKSLISKYFN